MNTHNSASELASVSANDIHTLSIDMHQDLYLRRPPMWNILGALEQKGAEDRPAFPALQTLILGQLPYYTRWFTLGVRSEVHYAPPALVGCLKARRDMGYPIASVRIPLKCRTAETEDGLEGLVYLEYF